MVVERCDLRTGTPGMDMSETNEWRRSRGVRPFPMAAAVQTARNLCRALAASRAAPVRVGKALLAPERGRETP